MTHPKYTTKKGGKDPLPPRDTEKLHDSTGITREQRIASAARTAERMRRQALSDRYDRLEADMDRQDDTVKSLQGQWFNEKIGRAHV